MSGLGLGFSRSARSMPTLSRDGAVFWDSEQALRRFEQGFRCAACILCRRQGDRLRHSHACEGGMACDHLLSPTLPTQDTMSLSHSLTRM